MWISHELTVDVISHECIWNLMLCYYRLKCDRINRQMHSQWTRIHSSGNWIKPNPSRWIVDLTGFIRIGDECVRSWTLISLSIYLSMKYKTSIHWGTDRERKKKRFLNYEMSSEHRRTIFQLFMQIRERDKFIHNHKMIKSRSNFS